MNEPIRFHAELMTEEEAMRYAIAERAMPRLMARRAHLMKEGFELIGVMLPRSLDTRRPEDRQPGVDRLMDLPVTWGDQLGLIVAAE